MPPPPKKTKDKHNKTLSDPQPSASNTGTGQSQNQGITLYITVENIAAMKAATEEWLYHDFNARMITRKKQIEKRKKQIENGKEKHEDTNVEFFKAELNYFIELQKRYFPTQAGIPDEESQKNQDQWDAFINGLTTGILEKLYVSCNKQRLITLTAEQIITDESKSKKKTKIPAKQAKIDEIQFSLKEDIPGILISEPNLKELTNTTKILDNIENKITELTQLKQHGNHKTDALWKTNDKTPINEYIINNLSKWVDILKNPPESKVEIDINSSRDSAYSHLTDLIDVLSARISGTSISTQNSADSTPRDLPSVRSTASNPSTDDNSQGFNSPTPQRSTPTLPTPPDPDSTNIERTQRTAAKLKKVLLNQNLQKPKALAKPTAIPIARKSAKTHPPTTESLKEKSQIILKYPLAHATAEDQQISEIVSELYTNINNIAIPDSPTSSDAHHLEKLDEELDEIIDFLEIPFDNDIPADTFNMDDALNLPKLLQQTVEKSIISGSQWTDSVFDQNNITKYIYQEIEKLSQSPGQDPANKLYKLFLLQQQLTGQTIDIETVFENIFAEQLKKNPGGRPKGMLNTVSKADHKFKRNLEIFTQATTMFLNSVPANSIYDLGAFGQHTKNLTKINFKDQIPQILSHMSNTIKQAAPLIKYDTKQDHDLPQALTTLNSFATQDTPAGIQQLLLLLPDRSTLSAPLTNDFLLTPLYQQLTEQNIDAFLFDYKLDKLETILGQAKQIQQDEQENTLYKNLPTLITKITDTIESKQQIELLANNLINTINQANQIANNPTVDTINDDLIALSNDIPHKLLFNKKSCP